MNITACNNKEKKMAVVYWIHLVEHLGFETEGYIGVAKDHMKRFYMHKQGHGNENVLKHKDNEDLLIDVVFEGTEEECYAYEETVRPSWRIGWNIAPGGFKPPSPLGNKERSAKASSSLKGRKITWNDKISATHKGKVIPQSTRDKISATLKGRVIPQSTRDKISSWIV